MYTISIVIRYIMTKAVSVSFQIPKSKITGTLKDLVSLLTDQYEDDTSKVRAIYVWLTSLVIVMVFNVTFNNSSTTMYIVVVSYIGGGNGSTRRKPPTCHKSRTNFII
jgi:hypothetical protein